MYKNMKRMALLLVAAATLFNVSCKKENKDNPGTDGSFIPAKVECDCFISFDPTSVEGITKGYDIFIDYFDVDGKIQSSTEINASNLTWQKKFTQTKFPTRFGAQVRMVPKSNLSGVPEDASFNLDGVIKLKGDLISTTGKTRNLFRESLIKRHGIEPHNGRSYKQNLRYEIKANGDSECFTTWVDE
jgi:hypothetical protein